MSIQYIYQAPLTHRAHGPGLILVIPDRYSGNTAQVGLLRLDPLPTQKWAEEGFCVLCITIPDRKGKEAFEGGWNEVLMQASQQLKKKSELTGEKLGLIGASNMERIRSSFLIIISIRIGGGKGYSSWTGELAWIVLRRGVSGSVACPICEDHRLPAAATRLYPICGW
jgi:hypothetical protein